MAVGDPDVAVRCYQHMRRPIEVRLVVAGDAGFAKGHQHLAFRAELEDLVTLADLVALRLRALRPPERLR